MSGTIAAEGLEIVQAAAPLVQNVTNYVVMNTTANALLALGASPIMAHAREESAQMAAICASVVLNIGTLDAGWVESMTDAARHAAKLDKPIVLDPVGAGASSLRTDTAEMLIRTAVPTVIRGNGSEIAVLAERFAVSGLAQNGDSNVQSRGVDSTLQSSGALDAARTLAETLNCIVSISGETDYITNGRDVLTVANGSPLMSRVTGMGCTATALTGACAAAIRNPLHAAFTAMTVMGVAGELTAERAAGPGSFQMHFLDVLYSLTPEILKDRFRDAS